MAKLHITEFTNQSTDMRGATVPAAQMPHNGHQVVAIGGAAAPSAALKGNTRMIRVHTDTPCNVEITAAGTAATANSMRMATDQTEYFGVNGGETISVIQGA